MNSQNIKKPLNTLCQNSPQLKLMVMLFVFIAFLGITNQATASFLKSSKPIDHEIKEVTLYSGKAGVERLANFNKPKGNSWVLVRSLPSNLIGSTLQFELLNSGTTKIRQIVLMESFEKLTLAEDLEKKLNNLEKLYSRHLDLSQKITLNGKVTSLLQGLNFSTPFNKNLGKENYSTFKANIGTLHSALNGISTESDENLRLKQNFIKELKEIHSKIESLSSEITDVTGSRTQDWRINAYLLLSSNSPAKGQVKIKYLIPNANWTPLYDVRAELNTRTGKAKIRLVTSGNVKQNTGEYWENVRLNFSTLDPSPLLNPEFRRWVLSEQRIEDIQPQMDSMGGGGIKGFFSNSSNVPLESRVAEKMQQEQKGNRAKIMKSAPSPKKVQRPSAPSPAEGIAADQDYESDALMEDEQSYVAKEKKRDSVSYESSLGAAVGRGGKSARITLFPATSLSKLYPRLASLNDGYQTYRSSKPQYRNYTDRLQVVSAPSMIQNKPLQLSSPFSTSVLSGSTDQKIPIKTETITGEIRYFAVPKDQKWGYVKLEARNPANRNLLAGEGQIFLNGELTSKTNIPSVGPKGKFWINLGPDRNIETKRKVDRKSEEKGLIMKDHSVSVSVELEILNHYHYPINLDIKDQIPLSSSKEVKVSKVVIENNGNKDKNGIITWDLNLKSREKRKIKFSYNVTHPKNFIVQGIDQ